MASATHGIDSIDTYFELIRSSELADLQHADGLLDGVVSENREVHTFHLIKAWRAYNGVAEDLSDLPKSFVEQAAQFDPAPGSKQAEKNLAGWRIAAASHVVRAMIQGDVLPTSTFDHVTRSALVTASLIEGHDGTRVSYPTRNVFKREIREVIGFSDRNSVTRERALAAKQSFKRAQFFGRISVDSQLEA